MKIAKLVVPALFATAMLAGCAGSEEYEISGEVTSTQAVSGPISLEFFEVAKDDEAAERTSLLKVELEALGSFTETVEVSSDANIVIFALEDQNGDDACTDGELWAEVEVTPNEDGTVDEVTLALTADPCPQ